MWIIFSLLGSFLLAVIGWLDEYLTAKNPFTGGNIIKEKVGSLFLVSTLFSVIGVTWLYLGLDSATIGLYPLVLSLFASITMVGMWLTYFYLLNVYPVYQVVPLFQLTSLWLILFEIIFRGPVAIVGLIGISLLVIGAYLLDVGAIKFSIPSSLLLTMAVVTFFYSYGVYAIRIASDLSNAWLVSYWQYVGVVGIGLITFVVIPVFRRAFIFRIKKQGKVFIGISSISESLAQIAYVVGNYAIALAPISAYATAMSSIQSIFVLGIFYLFPQKKVKINTIQVLSIFVMVLGAVLLELGKSL